MQITRISQLSQKYHTIDLDVTEEQMERFEKRLETGEYLQDIFSNLPASQREFIKTGITPEEWEEAFGIPEEEDDIEYPNVADNRLNTELDPWNTINLQDDPGDSQSFLKRSN